MAIYRSVHDYPGGAEALAPQMNKLSVHTLRHMADPKKTSHGWSFRRWDELIALAGTGPLEAHCLEHGGMFVPLGAHSEAQPTTLLKQMHKLTAEFCDVPRVIEQAVKRDGQISDNELRRIDQQIAELMSAAAATRGLVQQIHDQRTKLAEEQRP